MSISSEDLRRDILRLQLLVVQIQERVEKLEEEKVGAVKALTT